MRKHFLALSFCVLSIAAISQLKITGGVGLAKNSIDAEVLSQLVQQKQEEVFNRLLSNIIVKYFGDGDPNKGVYNFATYYSLYNIVTDLTVGKGKTTVSKAVFNSAAELAYMYAFIKFYQQQQIDSLQGLAVIRAANAEKIENARIVDDVDENDKPNKKLNLLLRLNFYLEASFDVLSKSQAVQDKFYFQRPVQSSEISIWYKQLGLKFNSRYRNIEFPDVTGKNIKLENLIDGMEKAVPEFLNYTGSDPFIKVVGGLNKTATGLQMVTLSQVEDIKVMLLQFANSTDYLFDQNVVKTLITLAVENIHFGADDNQAIKEVYVDVESLILSLDKVFVSKNKRSSMSSGCCWLVNARPFFTIGTANAHFLNDGNRLNTVDGVPAAMKNVSLASEKIGFRVKLYDPGYTHSFGPGEVYKFRGKNYVWTQPQRKPLLSSIYYNAYASGLLYNVLDLKTNKNFNFGYVASNIGVIFFNGLELSAGIGFAYEDGLEAKNSFFKLDFDVPIVDYIAALKNKNKK